MNFNLCTFLILICCWLPLQAQNSQVLSGAKNEVTNKTKYNTDMLSKYVAPTFFNGKNLNKPVYPDGDVNPSEGVCADLVVRALRYAGIDLQKRVHEDILSNLNSYGIKTPDKYIDHRRVWVLLKYFKRNYKSLSTEVDGTDSHWKHGDIIIWDIGLKDHYHIGIISDKKSGNRPLVIHNMRHLPFISPGITCEQDVLSGPRAFGIRVKRWKILGHFRIDEPKQ